MATQYEAKPDVGLAAKAAAISIALFCAAFSASTSAFAEERDRLTPGEFFGEIGQGPVSNHNFLPMGDFGPATHELSATLHIHQTRRFEFGRFPETAVRLFSDNGHLIPANRDIMRDLNGPNLLNIIFSPGRVWSEPGDNNYSRAAFPFALTGLASNRSHNGLAMFLYNDEAVSPMVFQIVQETSTSLKFDAWGVLPISLERRRKQEGQSVLAGFASDRVTRFPVYPLSELATVYGDEGQAASEAWPNTINRRSVVLF